MKLETLAERIRTELAGIRQAARNSLDHARIAGQHLEAAFEQVAKGDWGRWLVKNCNLSRATADLYRRIYREWDSLAEKIGNCPERVTLSGARSMLTAPSGKKKAVTLSGKVNVTMLCVPIIGLRLGRWSK